MSLRERLLQLFAVWLAVFPCVCLFSYAFVWLGIDWPLWAEILVSTMLTVPLITFVAQPLIETRIARMKGESRSDIKRAEARRVKEPDGGAETR